MSDDPAPRPTNPPEPRWPAVLALLAVGGLYLALPEPFSLGPRWLLLSLLVLLVIPALITHKLEHHSLNVLLGHALSITMTLFMLASLAILVRKLFDHSASPVALLRSAALLWLANVLIFASWYWHLDAGGPHARSQRLGHETGAFLFPQMTLDGPAGDNADGSPWAPQFVDYLFLAFNTSTAFSPTDAPALSRWAKGLMMTQSLLSLTTILLLFGRVVNIL